MFLLTLLIGAAAAALLLPTVSDLLSLARIALGGRHQRVVAARTDPRLLFLVPAHDEELLIESCLASLGQLRYPRTRFEVVVIADNCTDQTAALAVARGARCLERTQPELRGKPHAIAWALEQLGLAEYDAVVIVDADTVVDPEFATGLAAAAPLNGKAVQGYNGVLNPEDNAITRMAAVFADAKGRFAHPLKARAGLNVPLRLGGCIGTSVLAEHGWNAFSIGEDWELYVLLTSSGIQIEGVDNARVYAQEARSLRQSASQRKRWTAGKLTVLWRLLPAMLRSRRLSAHQKLDLIAELSGPGPAVHLGAASFLAVGSALLGVPGAGTLIFALAAGVFRHACYAFAALLVQPRPWRAMLAFAVLPFYAAWRLGIEIAALRMLGDKPWVRTERHRPAPG